MRLEGHAHERASRSGPVVKPGDNDLYYGESNQGHTIYEDGTCLTGGHAGRANGSRPATSNPTATTP